jgi:hypothetical protein
MSKAILTSVSALSGLQQITLKVGEAVSIRSTPGIEIQRIRKTGKGHTFRVSFDGCSEGVTCDLDNLAITIIEEVVRSGYTKIVGDCGRSSYTLTQGGWVGIPTYPALSNEEMGRLFEDMSDPIMGTVEDAS